MSDTVLLTVLNYALCIVEADCFYWEQYHAHRNEPCFSPYTRGSLERAWAQALNGNVPYPFR